MSYPVTENEKLIERGKITKTNVFEKLFFFKKSSKDFSIISDINQSNLNMKKLRLRCVKSKIPT